MPTVAVVDNHEAILYAVAAQISATADLTCIGTYRNVDELLAAEPADVVVLDLYLERDSSTTAASIPSILATGSQVVVHTAEERPAPLRTVVRNGAIGVSLKNDGLAALLDVIRNAARNEFSCSSVLAGALVTGAEAAVNLSAREVEVLRGLDDGLTQRHVAARLGISEETVKSHLRTIRAKYRDANRPTGTVASVIREATADGFLGTLGG